MQHFLVKLLGGIALLGAACVANAATLDGAINIIGYATVDPALPGATKVVFVSGSAGFGDGDLAVINGASTTDGSLTLNNFTFDPFTSSTTIWSSTRIGGLTFTLDPTITVAQSATDLTISGVGTLSATGYDSSLADFTLTYNKLTKQTVGSFSSSTSVVPIPAAAWLFGSGMIGVASIARRGRKNRI